MFPAGSALLSNGGAVEGSMSSGRASTSGGGESGEAESSGAFVRGAAAAASAVEFSFESLSVPRENTKPARARSAAVTPAVAMIPRFEREGSSVTGAPVEACTLPESLRA